MHVYISIYIIMRKIILFSVIQQLLYHISSVDSLIGQNVIPITNGEFPFIASFQYFPQERNFCVGALITKKHIITSARCLENITPERFRIIFEVANAQVIPAVAYTVDSWTTYASWAKKKRISYDRYDMAIVTLTCRVYNVKPVPLNGLKKTQLDGKEAIMIGRMNDVLSKTTVNLLSDENSEINIHNMLLNGTFTLDARGLRTSANPFALLSHTDVGSPLLHARDNSLLGIAFAAIPSDALVRDNFTIEFIRQHQVNLYFSVDYYRLFIYSIIPAVPAA